MAEQTPFDPAVDALVAQTHGQPSYNMINQGFGMGADPLPKPGLTGPMAQAGLPPWMIPFAALAGLRARPQTQPPVMNSPQMGTNQPRRMISDNDNARDPNNVAMPMLNTGNQRTMAGSADQSHVARLNALSQTQFEAYRQAKAAGKSAEQAMVIARGVK